MAGTGVGGVMGCVSSEGIASKAVGTRDGTSMDETSQIRSTAARAAATTIQNADAVSSMFRDGGRYASRGPPGKEAAGHG